MDDKIKNINSVGWTILGFVGGAAILGASAIIKMIKNKTNNLTEKQKEYIGFSVMFSEFLKRSKQNITGESKKLESFLKEKLNRSGFKDVVLVFNELIKNKSVDTKTFAGFYKNMNYSVRLQMFRMLVSFQTGKADFKDIELGLKEIAELLNLSTKDFESIIAMNNPSLQSAYKILQLDENASMEEIKNSFRKLSKLYHPDKVEHLGDEFKQEASKNFQNILNAYELIKKAYR